MLALPSLSSKPAPHLARVKTYTFGCKVNRFDTAGMEARLLASENCRLADASEPADVVIINTCTVTSSADRQARQLMRRVHREHPKAKIVVTGCYAERESDFLQSYDGVTHVVPIAKQNELPEILGWKNVADENIPLSQTGTQTRALLKLQDGCNAYCSFCVLPYVRGRSRSLPLSELVDQARLFAQNGYSEIVLTGTHLGAYGRDLEPRLRFSDSLLAISDAVPTTALRVSSLEPTTLLPDVIRVVSERPQFRPHFHIPLQSGSDSVLRRMNRKYSVKHYSDRVNALARTCDDMAVGTDVIVGYPGETHEEFAETLRVVRDLPITYLHVFPYSSRPGTRAATMHDDVSPQLKKERVHRLMEVSRRKRSDFHSRFLGTSRSVLVEHKRDRKGRLTGYTPHYVPVHFHGPDRLMEREVDVRLVSLDDDFVVGEIE